MAEQGSAEKSEEPTGRRLSHARADGQVARSVDLSTAVVLLTATLIFSMMGEWFFHRIGQLFVSQFQFDRKIMDKPELLPAIFAQSVVDGMLVAFPIMVSLVIIAILVSGLPGGFIFSPKLILPKFSKLNPLSGLSRIFGKRALIELTKSVGKFVLIGTILLLTVMHNLDALLLINRLTVEEAVRQAGHMILDACFWMSLGLVLIAVIDVPLQRHQVHENLKMTKQEVRDEMKDSEGRPEVKAQIRRRQREMATQKMMGKVKDADVVITNPQHFAVALAYDPTSDGAPMLIAKGTDLVARRIREIAREEGVEVFESPQLARALFFTTQLDDTIPEALYHAVAQVIAYVFSLNDAFSGRQRYEKPQPDIPENMRFDENGFLQT
jgi:flagellar biosynthetic protein FlhB